MALAGCGAGGAVFGSYDLPETPEVTAAEWPRLAESEDAATLAAEAPDPAGGRAIHAELTAEAAVAAARAAELGQPLLSEAERRRLRGAATE